MEILATILPYVQIILSVLLVISVLLQQNEAGLGAAFGGGGGDTITRTRRGLEKTLFNATIIIAILFVAVSIIALFV